MAMYIYICIYTETDPPPPNKEEGSQIAWRDGRFETEVPSTEEEKQKLRKIGWKKKGKEWGRAVKGGLRQTKDAVAVHRGRTKCAGNPALV